MFKRVTAFLVITCFNCTLIVPPQAKAAEISLNLPLPGTMINLSQPYEPVIIRGLTIHKDNPLLFDFIVDVGQDNMSGAPLKKEGEKLIKYFLASLAIPDKDVWVNLSPYEKNKIIPDVLGQTDMGRDLLEQDYILKQITASLIYPEKRLGKIFWDKVYAKARAMYGTTQIPVNTFNKVWIMADRAEVFEHNQTAFVVDSHLKVMLEEDYLALTKHQRQPGDSPTTHSIASNIVKEIILPQLEKEVNTGKNFANLRQIFNSIILSSWYKKSLKQALLNQVYANKDKVKGVVASGAKQSREQIYEQYLKAYKKGVFNYIKEDINAANGQDVPRKYFSGGILATGAAGENGLQVTRDLTVESQVFENIHDPLKDFATLATIGQPVVPAMYTDEAMTVINTDPNTPVDLTDIHVAKKIEGMEDKDAMAEEVVDSLEDALERASKEGRDPVIVVGTGEHLEIVYNAIIRRYIRNKNWDLSNVRVFGQDEYFGLPGDHEQSYRLFIMKKFIDELIRIDPRRAINPDNFISFNGDVPSTEEEIKKEIQRVTNKIKEWGGIDWEILAGGEDGHFAFVVPAVKIDSLESLQTSAMQSDIRKRSEVLIDKKDFTPDVLEHWINEILRIRQEQLGKLSQAADVLEDAVNSRKIFLRDNRRPEPKNLRAIVAGELDALGQRMLREQTLVIYISDYLRVNEMSRTLPPELRSKILLKPMDTFWTEPAKVAPLSLTPIILNSRYFESLEQIPVRAFTFVGLLLAARQIVHISFKPKMASVLMKMILGPLAPENPFSILIRQVGRYKAIFTREVAEAIKRGSPGNPILSSLFDNAMAIHDAALIASPFRLDIPEITGVDGGKILTNDKIDPRANTAPFPINKTILVLEMAKGDSKKYAGGTIELLRRNGNRVKIVTMDEGWQERNLRVKPDIILAPNDLYHPQVGIRNQLQAFTEQLGWPVDAILYRSDKMPPPINRYLPFNQVVLDINKKGMGVQETQTARTGYVGAIEDIALHWGNEFSPDRANEPYANVYDEEILYPDGHIDHDKQAGLLDIDHEAPALLAAPHPDDEAFSGGTIRRMLEKGRDVTVFLQNDGWCGVGTMRPDQYKLAIEYLQNLEKDPEAAEAFWSIIARDNQIYRPYVEQWKKEGWKGKEVPAEVIARKTRLWNIKGLRRQILEWNENKKVTPSLHEIATHVIRPFIELEEEKKHLQENVSGKLNIIHLKLPGGLWPPSLGSAPQEILDMDQKIIEEKLEQFYTENKDALERDEEKGKRMQIFPPHRLDRHPHHVGMAKAIAPTLIHFTHHHNMAIEVDYYLAAWAGDEDLSVHYGDELEREVYAGDDGAQPFKRALAILNGELSRKGGFGEASPTPKEMGGRYVERFTGVRLVPKNLPGLSEQDRELLANPGPAGLTDEQKIRLAKKAAGTLVLSTERLRNLAKVFAEHANTESGSSEIPAHFVSPYYRRLSLGRPIRNEDVISGKYRGEIARTVLMNLIDHGLLFHQAQDLPVIDSRDVNSYFSGLDLRKVIQKWNIVDPSDADLKIVADTFNQVLAQSKSLSAVVEAIAYDAAMTAVAKGDDPDPYNLAVRGSNGNPVDLVISDLTGTLVNVVHNSTGWGQAEPLPNRIKNEWKRRFEANSVLVIATGDRFKDAKMWFIDQLKLPPRLLSRIIVMSQSTMIGHRYDLLSNQWVKFYDAYDELSPWQQEHWEDYKKELKRIANDTAVKYLGKLLKATEDDEDTIIWTYERGRIAVRSHQLAIEAESSDQQGEMVDDMRNAFKNKKEKEYLEFLGFEKTDVMPAGDVYVDLPFIPDVDKEKGLEALEKKPILKKMLGVDKIPWDRDIGFGDSFRGNDGPLGRFLNLRKAAVVSVGRADHSSGQVPDYVIRHEGKFGPEGVLFALTPEFSPMANEIIRTFEGRMSARDISLKAYELRNTRLKKSDLLQVLRTEDPQYPIARQGVLILLRVRRDLIDNKMWHVLVQHAYDDNENGYKGIEWNYFVRERSLETMYQINPTRSLEYLAASLFSFNERSSNVSNCALRIINKNLSKIRNLPGAQKVKEAVESVRSDGRINQDIVNEILAKWDYAQLSTRGGIDLNTSNGMRWKSTKEGNGVEIDVDPAMLARIREHGIDSLSPFVFRITPVIDFWQTFKSQ